MQNKSFWKFLIAFAAIILLVLGGYWLWNNRLSPEAKQAREMNTNYERYFEYQKNLEDAMRADTYGGKTPQETLNLFIEALRKNDVDLAFLYFNIEENGGRDPKWKEGLVKTKEAGKLQEVADQLVQAKPAGSSIEGYFGFEIRDSSGNLVSDVGMKLNTYSGVWKIEGL